MTGNQQLLADYVENGSEAAFRELVARYVDFVYSTAIRLVGGDSHLAEDVSQTVFVDLARMARKFSPEVMLGGWLHRHVCFVAATVMRGERRRQARERQAMEMNALNDHSETNLAQVTPILDEAINQLGAQDRAAILLRFFEKRDLRSVGEALGSNEDAARKRVSRALDKLQALLKHRGVSLSAAGLAAFLAADAVTAAPAGLAITFSGTALANAAIGVGTSLTLLKIMSLTKLKIGLATALVATGIATPIVLQQRANAELRAQIESLRQQAGGVPALRDENERLAKMQVDAGELDKLRAEHGELLRLRGQATAARQQEQELASARAEISRLRAQPAQGRAVPPGKSPPGAGEVIPRESWAFAGYETPEAGMQTFFWAMNKGDIKAIMASVGPEMVAEVQKELGDKTEDHVKEMSEQQLKDTTGLAVVGQRAISDDIVAVTVMKAMTGGNEQEEWIMKRVGGEWRFYGHDKP